MGAGHTLTPTAARRIVEVLRPHVAPARLGRQLSVLGGRHTVRLVLENISDDFNASACLRTADGLGVQDVHVVESYAAFRTRDDIAKSSAKWLTLHRHRSAPECLLRLKEKGYTVLAANLCAESVPLDQLTLPDHGRVALVFGNEHRGVSQAVASLADTNFVLPMTGFVQSFNISASVAMSLWHLHTSGCMQTPLPDENRARVLAGWLLREVVGSEQILQRAGVRPYDF